jgi:hypothetical protein
MRAWQQGVAAVAEIIDEAKARGGRMNHEPNLVDGTRPDKMQYAPPQLTTISLRPEEAVLGHCKVAGSSGPSTASCMVLFCSSIGS